MDYRLALMTGTDIPIPECQLVLHQPTAKEIGLIGEEDFFLGLQTLWIDKNRYVEDETLLSNETNFHIFMTIMREKEYADRKKAATQLLSIVFPNYKINFLPSGTILFNKNGENIIIDENNFDFLQDTLRQVFCYKTSTKDDFNPANEEARKIAQKLLRGRQRVAQQKRGDSEGSMFSIYLSTLSVGLQIPLTVLSNYTMYQIYDIYERYTLYTNWDVDLRARLAGANPDSSPENWMKNIH